MHDDVGDNVAAHLVQEVGDARAAIAAAPHRLHLDLRIERSASMPMEGKGEIKVRQGYPGPLMQSPFSFKQYGNSGAWVSSRLDIAW